tara:strand:+ start:192 stop:419 length:228 start_codon:yes stop_codon:yes gene_type:complete
MKKIYIAQMPDIDGYGLRVISANKKTALKELEKGFNKWTKDQPYYNFKDFDGAMKWFSGSVTEYTLDKCENGWLL